MPAPILYRICTTAAGWRPQSTPLLIQDPSSSLSNPPLLEIMEEQRGGSTKVRETPLIGPLNPPLVRNRGKTRGGSTKGGGRQGTRVMYVIVPVILTQFRTTIRHTPVIGNGVLSGWAFFGVKTVIHYIRISRLFWGCKGGEG